MARLSRERLDENLLLGNDVTDGCHDGKDEFLFVCTDFKTTSGGTLKATDDSNITLE
jgi:hypothetical protein